MYYVYRRDDGWVHYVKAKHWPEAASILWFNRPWNYILLGTCTTPEDAKQHVFMERAGYEARSACDGI